MRRVEGRVIIQDVCHYTGVAFDHSKGIVLGAVVPQAPYSYLCAPDAKPARAASVKLFNDTVELNCNTCAELQRLPFKKNVSGLQPGTCDNIPADHPYHRGDHFLFAPEDCMMMKCYIPRGCTK